MAGFFFFGFFLAFLLEYFHLWHTQEDSHAGNERRKETKRKITCRRDFPFSVPGREKGGGVQPHM